jgi:hypothetical protein
MSDAGFVIAAYALTAVTLAVWFVMIVSKLRQHPAPRGPEQHEGPGE